jgi:Protein of unknown function (DUF3617)
MHLVKRAPTSMGLVLGLLAAAQFAAGAEPMNIRPGLWETTTTSKTTLTGKPSMGPDAATLNSMPPEQRAKIEALMKQYSSGEPRVETTQYCVTPEQVAKGPGFLGKESPQCKTEVLEQSRTDYHFRQQCSGSGGNSNAEIKVHLNNPESATIAMDGTNTSDGRSMTLSGKAASKWIGSDCGKLQRK